MIKVNILPVHEGKIFLMCAEKLLNVIKPIDMETFTVHLNSDKRL